MTKKTGLVLLLAVLGAIAACSGSPKPVATGPSAVTTSPTPLVSPPPGTPLTTTPPGPSPVSQTTTSGMIQWTSPAHTYTIQVPPSWVTTTVCSGSSANLCSTATTQTATDVWYDPANPGRRVTVNTCAAPSCFASDASGSPIFPPAIPGASVTQTISRNELRFTLPAGTHPQGPYTIHGTAVGSQPPNTGLAPGQTTNGPPTFPVYTVWVSLPDAEQNLAQVLLNNFQVLVPGD